MYICMSPPNITNMTILGLIKGSGESVYRDLLLCCMESLNRGKTCEPIIHFRKLNPSLQSLYINRTEALRKAGGSGRPLTPANKGLVESIFNMGITVWYGNITQAKKRAPQRVTKTAEQIIRPYLTSFYSVHT
ncbi:unnamed protein product [Menidia menidia]|uniref:(Atlantic silverside) hypothetical protein n=1 Tax=Menidia menidia TaxID=238744 RepID=A0A8S4AF40_9TELE|nr:unnamed protein product [Menidia menidia]